MPYTSWEKNVCLYANSIKHWQKKHFEYFQQSRQGDILHLFEVLREFEMKSWGRVDDFRVKFDNFKVKFRKISTLFFF